MAGFVGGAMGVRNAHSGQVSQGGASERASSDESMGVGKHGEWS